MLKKTLFIAAFIASTNCKADTIRFEVLENLVEYITSFSQNKDKKEVKKIINLAHEITLEKGGNAFPRLEDTLAVIAVESGFRPQVMSKGNYGLMQINASAHDISSPKKLLDPRYNLEKGVGYLTYLHERRKNKKSALNSFNVGPYANRSNKEYVEKVLKQRAAFKEILNEG